MISSRIRAAAGILALASSCLSCALLGPQARTGGEPGPGGGASSQQGGSGADQQAQPISLSGDALLNASLLDPAGSPTTLAGIVGAKVTARSLDGTAVAETTTGAGGSYTLQVPAAKGLLQIEVDLATVPGSQGSTLAAALGDKLQAARLSRLVAISGADLSSAYRAQFFRAFFNRFVSPGTTALAKKLLADKQKLASADPDQVSKALEGADDVAKKLDNAMSSDTTKSLLADPVSAESLLNQLASQNADLAAALASLTEKVTAAAQATPTPTPAPGATGASPTPGASQPGVESVGAPDPGPLPTDPPAASPGPTAPPRPTVVLDGEVIAKETIWDAAHDWEIKNGLNIQAKLTIQPGTRVRFGRYSSVWVGAEIIAEGTAGEPIVFEATSSAQTWGGLDFEGGIRESVLRHCLIRDVEGTALKVMGRLRLTDTTISHTRGVAVLTGPAQPSYLAEFARNVFEDGTDCPLAVYAGDTTELDTATVLRRNAPNLIKLMGLGVNSTISPPYRYLLASDANVTGGRSLTILPGAWLYIADGKQLSFKNGGYLSAEGTSDKPIVIDSAQAASGKSDIPKGAWKGISLAGGSHRIANCWINHGGSGGNSALQLSSGAALDIKRSTIANSALHGISVDASSSLSGFARNLVSKNASHSVALPAPRVGALDKPSRFEGNGADAVLVSGGTLTTDQTWPGRTYDVTGSIVVDGPVLTLGASASLRFGQGSDLQIGPKGHGALVTGGTPDGPVSLVAPPGSESRKGFWQGVQIWSGQSSTPSVLVNTRITNGGVAGTGASLRGNLSVEKAGKALLYGDCRFEYSAGPGIAVAASGSLVAEATPSFAQNASGDTIVTKPN